MKKIMIGTMMGAMMSVIGYESYLLMSQKKPMKNLLPTSNSVKSKSSN